MLTMPHLSFENHSVLSKEILKGILTSVCDLLTGLWAGCGIVQRAGAGLPRAGSGTLCQLLSGMK